MNAINVVTIGKLIAAHREGDEEKFRAYHLSIDDVKPITAQAAELLKAPINGIAN